jgi:GNAT superfamily N-acetyltransferase
MAYESSVVFANEFDRDDIINIWEKCFGDEKEYIEMYLDNRFETENMLVIHEDGRPVSMASFLPVEIFINGEYISAKYVYAVATLPEYRNKGYASKILKYAADKYKMPLILQPESEELVKYYENIGYVTGFKDSPSWIHAYRPCELTDTMFEISDISAKKYMEIRDRHFEENGYVKWDEKAIEYAIRENEYCNGKTIHLMKTLKNGDITEDIMMYRIDDNGRLKVMETTLEDEELSCVTTWLMDSLGVQYAYARNHGGMINMVNPPFNEGYLGLTLG